MILSAFGGGIGTSNAQPAWMLRWPKDFVSLDRIQAGKERLVRIIAIVAQRSQRDQGPIFRRPNSTLPRCLLPLYDHHLFVIFASFCTSPFNKMVAGLGQAPDSIGVDQILSS